MQRRLVEANLKQQDQPLAEVLGLLTVLAEPWNNTSLNWNGSAYKPWASADLSAEERGRIAVSA
jgi:flagellin-specific chaperone FliS